MDFEEAVKRAVRKFYEGRGYDSYESATGKTVKHSKEWFDDFEKEIRKKIGPEDEEVEKEEMEVEGEDD